VKDDKVGVVMGGPSAERAVSLHTGAGVLAALCERGYDAVGIDWRPGTSLAAALAAAEVAVVWNALHGCYGEDGAVQGLLACAGIPGTGSGILASALAFDKVASKRAFEVHDVPVPPWSVVRDDEDAVGALPCVIKPAREGSSVGVTVVHERAEVPAALARARACHGPVIVEQFIAGTEVHVGVLDDAVLGDVEVRPARGFYDYAAKYERDDTGYVVPAPLAADVAERAHTVALRAYRALGCRGHGRVDLRIDAGGVPFVLEVNTLPGMTATSLLPKIAAHAGLDYATLCERILASASLG